MPSKRRNPLLADFFNRLGLMERRGSGMKKIINADKQFEHLAGYHLLALSSNETKFHVTLWNLNYHECVIGEISSKEKPMIVEARDKDGQVFVKGQPMFAKEFVKASRQIYKLISQNPQISATMIAENIGLSARQVQKYMRRLQDLNKIQRIGGRKNGEWKIID